MTDDNLDDVQAPKLIALSERDKIIWNEALKKAISIAEKYESYGVAYEIRLELKI